MDLTILKNLALGTALGLGLGTMAGPAKKLYTAHQNAEKAVTEMKKLGYSGSGGFFDLNVNPYAPLEVELIALMAIGLGASGFAIAQAKSSSTATSTNKTEEPNS